MAIFKRDGVDGDNHFPKKFVELFADGAITAGDWVAVSNSTTKGVLGTACKKAAAVGTNGNSGVFGIATETVVDGALVRVQTAGKFDTANVHADCDVGLGLAGPISVAGRADLAVAATFQMCGIALSDDSATTNVAAVMIIDQGLY
tara:strand:- start:55 stop:492 length:438 start_codon:yes stop_codon:yes gene_type:complete